MKKYLLPAIIFLAFQISLFSQSTKLWRPAIDVDHYHFTLQVEDESDNITGEASIDLTIKEEISEIILDLIQPNEEGKGMKVFEVLSGESSVPYIQSGDSLIISTPSMEVGSQQHLKVFYRGVPQDGFIIGSNKHGDRTFFADNWPNRAHNWLPCVDHPSDKATVSFTVRAPNHYQVIANGALLEEIDVSETVRQYEFGTQVRLPTKVMVVGIAAFAVQNLPKVEGIPLSSWIYPEDKDNGFYDYSQAAGILDFFIDKIGPYPYLKLANVQSSTRFGGMENAGNIFYSEKSVTGNRSAETLLAHEIAHQWFGNSASEADWPHFWLSEGFATYMTNHYVELTYGRDSLVSSLKGQRASIIRFYSRRQTPVVDTSVTNLMSLLNANSYQKGGWVLHMLRHKLGEDAFWSGIKTYYQRYTLSNATTDDFREVMEEVSGQDLEQFFHQWLYTAGHPNLSLDWEQSGDRINIKIYQEQDSGYIFSFPLDIQFLLKDGTSKVHTIEIEEDIQSFILNVQGEVDSVLLDPGVWLLFE